ncbi:S-methyl-5'-thioinosine phosphorylase [sulfur-oxidizing endosymbiont of Gigantopelta aegis]|uniref:S-methyl-5'-thioinosine phosphorylase n=1 Tax=sulfur-oxidizing endosymbiont of Gigantopelta aegis TaxID=2794934 RepID=UPI0018DC9883|nr:S-methyl-5'-thioinosine phosphorylase [sulfur-oxidizing endosymbiont of Gigantopelta aegis]
MSKTKKHFGIIGGTGLTALENLQIVRREIARTPFGEASSTLSIGRLIDEQQADNATSEEVVFLARHGHAHSIPPHMINYRANIWGLKEAGVNTIISVNAVGGIREDMVPGSLALPDQIIDYTTHRVNTFFETNLTSVTHIDFSYPYDEALSQLVLSTAQEEGIDIIKGGTYAATEGPRLETAAEIQRLKRDGCDLVGMTGMPEAALARELGIDYVSICVNANWAAGLSDELITMDVIEKNITDGLKQVRRLLVALLNKS